MCIFWKIFGYGSSVLVGSRDTFIEVLLASELAKTGFSLNTPDSNGENVDFKDRNISQTHVKPLFLQYTPKVWFSSDDKTQFLDG